MSMTLLSRKHVHQVELGLGLYREVCKLPNGELVVHAVYIGNLWDTSPKELELNPDDYLRDDGTLDPDLDFNPYVDVIPDFPDEAY